MKKILGLAVLAASALMAVPMFAADKVELTSVKDVQKSAYAKDFELQGEYITTENGRGYQVIADGNGKFRVVGYPGGLPGKTWDRSMARFFGTGEFKDGKLIVVGQKMNIPKRAETNEDPNIIFNEEQKARPMAFTWENGKCFFLNKKNMEAVKVERKSPTLGQKAPEGAEVIFDGSNLDKFLPGAKMNEETKTLWSEACAKPFQKDKIYLLHLEFMTSFMPLSKGQARANSGVYIDECYECQVLDSFGLEGENNECGGFYQSNKPAVNMCFSPLTWQTYDIEFIPAKFKEGKKVANARVTVLHNGVMIHDDLELKSQTPGRKKEADEARGLYLQGHGNKVQYRNIWIKYED